MKVSGTIFGMLGLVLAIQSAFAAEPIGFAQKKEDIKKYWNGIQQDNYSIPYGGMANRFLWRLGLAYELRGTLINAYPEEKGYHFVQGKVSTFGGESDHGVKKREHAALTGEYLRQLDGSSDYYAAMRFNYGHLAGSGKNFWRDSRLLVVNPRNGRAVIVRPIDWGPHPRTRRIIDVSPAALRALGATTDDTVWVSFAEPSSQIGPIR